MIRSIEIRNFKGLSACGIDKMSRVNLFVGKNNVGKSSLLEAISLLLAEGSPRWIMTLLENRGLETYFRTYGGESRGYEIQSNITSLYTGRDTAAFLRDPLVISASGDDGSEVGVSLKLGSLMYSTTQDENGDPIQRRIYVNPDEVDTAEDLTSGLMVSFDKEMQFYPFSRFDSRVRMESASATKRNFEFVRPSSIFSSDNAELFDRIAMTELQHWLVRALNIIDPRIRDVNFLQDPLSLSDRRPVSQRVPHRVPIVVLQGDDTRYPLRSMGDGVNRILTIVLSMLNCTGGMLLVDEFENGLHYTALCQLWKMIFQLAKELDIQVFVTSHSNDCIRSFIEADADADGVIMRLEDRGDGIVGVPYTDPDELEYINRNNVEIR